MRMRAAVVCSLLIGLAAGRAAADELEQRLAAANPKRGQLLYMQCKACHDAEARLPHQAGPNLNGVFGRTAGTAPGIKHTAPFTGRNAATFYPTLERANRAEEEALL
mgnify:CR=1 FL=1